MWEAITARQQALEHLVRDGHVEAVTALRCLVEAVTALRCLGEAHTRAGQFSDPGIWSRVICEIVDPLIAALESSTPDSPTHDAGQTALHGLRSHAEGDGRRGRPHVGRRRPVTIGWPSESDALAASTSTPPRSHRLADGSYAAAAPVPCHFEILPGDILPTECGILPDGRHVKLECRVRSGRWSVACGAYEPDVRCWYFWGSYEGFYESWRACESQAHHAVWSARPGIGGPRYLCNRHAAAEDEPQRSLPILRDALAASFVACAFVGTVHGQPADLLAQWLSGDAGAREILLDLAEEMSIATNRQIHGAWPVTPRPRVDRHGTGDNPHVFFRVGATMCRGAELDHLPVHDRASWRCTCGRDAGEVWQTGMVTGGEIADSGRNALHSRETADRIDELVALASAAASKHAD